MRYAHLNVVCLQGLKPARKKGEQVEGQLSRNTMEKDPREGPLQLRIENFYSLQGLQNRPTTRQMKRMERNEASIQTSQDPATLDGTPCNQKESMGVTSSQPLLKNIKEEQKSESHKRRNLGAPIRHVKCRICSKQFSNNYFLKRHHAVIHMARRKLVRNVLVQRLEKKYNFVKTSSRNDFEKSNMLRTRKHSHKLHKYQSKPKHVMNRKSTYDPKSVQWRYACDECDETFSEFYLVRDHVQVQHKGQLLECTLCDRKFKSRTSLNRHRAGVHGTYGRIKSVGVTRRLCRICNVSFSTQQMFREHVEATHTVQVECNKTLDVTTPYFLRKPSASAPVSGRARVVFKKITAKKSPKVLNLHVEEDNKSKSDVNDNSTITCTFCDMVFTQQTDVRQHLKSVHRDKRFSCDECHKTFTRKDTVRTHKKIAHAGKKTHQKKRFYCQKCNKHYALLRSLRDHIKVHHDGGSFTCGSCNASFRSRHGLEYHTESVHKCKKFSCQKCDKVYSTPDNLRRHVKVAHEGHLRNKYECTRCGRKFTNIHKHRKRCL